MQIPGKYDMADMAKRLSNSMKEKHYEPGECLTEVCACCSYQGHFCSLQHSGCLHLVHLIRAI